MIIRQDFSKRGDLPPKAFLMQVMDKTTELYCYLWDKKGEDGKILLKWREIKKVYNSNAFRTSLRKLCSTGLLNYKEDLDDIVIEMVSWEEIEA
jgi:hypothetical protein